MLHLFSSLARTSCYTGLNEPKLQSLENKVFEFEFEFSLSLVQSSLFFSLFLFFYVLSIVCLISNLARVT